MEKQIVLGALAALAQESRLDAFRLLVQAGPAGLSAGALSEALGIPSATLSFHLKELRNAGIVSCRREGRSKIYAPEFQAVRELLAYLSENCCRGMGRRAPPAGSRRRAQAS